MTGAQVVTRILDAAEDPKRVFRQFARRIPGLGEVDIHLFREDEHIQPDFDDPEDIRWINQQLEQGNEWAWCVAHVRVSWTSPSGRYFHADEYLGGCSYRSRSDFKQPGGYYDDMVKQAYDELVKAIEMDQE